MRVSKTPYWQTSISRPLPHNINDLCWSSWAIHGWGDDGILSDKYTSWHVSRLQHSGSLFWNTVCMRTQTRMCTHTAALAALKMACQGPFETVRRANMPPTVITPCNRSNTHIRVLITLFYSQSGNGKDNKLLSWPPLRSQIYDPLTNFSIYSVV